jgi:hypothetical protein
MNQRKYSEISIHHHIHGGSWEEQWIQENDRCGGHNLTIIHSGTTEIDDGLGKIIHLWTIDQEFTVPEKEN